MKALSVKQPYASKIASGEKTIETRTRPTHYRGPLLICASSRPKLEGHPAGVALCVVQVIDCRPMTIADEAAACVKLYAGAWAWILERSHLVAPFPVTGRISFFEVPFPHRATGRTLARPPVVPRRRTQSLP
jgi:hypothetical protein